MVKFIDSPAFRGQQIDHRTLYTESFVLKTNGAGTMQFAIPVRGNYVPQWKHWENIYEEFRVVSVTAELLPFQGSAIKGVSVLWWDTGLNPDAPTPTQALGRTSSIYRNFNTSKKPITLTYTFKEVEDLAYIETNSGSDFGTCHFMAYSDSATFDSPTDTFLYFLRFKYNVVFKTLRVLE